VHERLVLYKRLANCETPEALERRRKELVTALACCPIPHALWIECHRLRLLGKPLGLARIDASETQSSPVHPQAPDRTGEGAQLVHRKKQYRLAGQDKLHIELKLPESRPHCCSQEALGELS